jgi:hypothetical protein
VRVPKVDRPKILFPINIADFMFKDGVQVISAKEVEDMTSQNQPTSGLDFDSVPFLSILGSELRDENVIKKESVITS